MSIIKRDGRVSPLDITQVRKQTKPACDGLGIDYEELEINASISFTENMKTEDIQKHLISAALNITDVDKPNGVFVAGRLRLYNLYHNVKYTYFNKKVKGDIYKAITFSDYHNFNSKKLSYSLDGFDIDKINNAINGKRDKLFTFLAVDSLIKRYLIKTNGIVTELPQHFLMSVACFLASEEEDKTGWAIKFYELFSNLQALMATPTLANGRLIKGNCFSCAVGSTPDSIEGIFDSYKNQALGSKFGTGIGWDWTRVRALGGQILDYPGAAGGTIPFLKMEEQIMHSVDQLGSRLGAINVNMESWHKDILDYIDLKKSGGEERRTAEDLFISLSASDVFMERVDNDEDWTLFDPHDCLELAETYGDEFRKHYLKYEEMFKTNPEYFTNKPIVIKAKKLWKKFQSMAFGAGNPFIYFKDNANNALQPVYEDVGLIRSMNLCMEFASPIKDKEVNLCNLASINLARVSIDELPNVIKVVTRALDNVIDLTYYPMENSEQTQKDKRSIGLGICGEAEAITQVGILYGSKEHGEWIDKVYEIYATESDNASRELAKERGTCKYSDEFRNYHRRCIAPNSGIGLLFGTSNSIEAVYDKVWMEENIYDSFKVTAPNINPSNYNLYINAYDVNQLDSIRMTAKRQKYVDMGISHNIYLRPENVTGKMLFDIYMLAWKLGLKSIYYIRSKSLKIKEEIRDTESEIACYNCGG